MCVCSTLGVVSKTLPKRKYYSKKSCKIRGFRGSRQDPPRSSQGSVAQKPGETPDCSTCWKFLWPGLLTAWNSAEDMRHRGKCFGMEDLNMFKLTSDHQRFLKRCCREKNIQTRPNWVLDFGLIHCIVLFKHRHFGWQIPKSPSTTKKTELRVPPKSQLRQSLASCSEDGPLKSPVLAEKEKTR